MLVPLTARLLSGTSHGTGHRGLVQRCGTRSALRCTGRGPGCHEDILLCSPRQAGGQALPGTGVGSTVPSRHGYRRALPPLESWEEETNALNNLSSRSRSRPPLLHVPNTILVKALRETPACVLPASSEPRSGLDPGSGGQRRALLQPGQVQASSEVGVDSLMKITSRRGSNSS